jgi:cell division septum initiation protein DivIVA
VTSNDPETSDEQFRSEPPTTGISVGGQYDEGGYPPSPGVTTPDNAPLTPPADIPPLPYQGATSSDAPSTADVAKDQAASVAGGAADAAQHVAGVARDQVGQLAAEGGRQARELLGQAKSELSGQAQVQQDRVAGGLRAVGHQLSSMAESSQDRGVATDLARQAAQKAHQIAGWLEQRDPGSVLDEVRAFARQRPGAFLAIALGAGVVTGRLVRGLSADPDTTSSAGSATTRANGQYSVGYPPPAPLLDPAPVYGTPGNSGPLAGDLFATENSYRADQTDWTDLSARTSDTPR